MVVQSITISGTKFNDLTGNGFSSDDPGQCGVTIDLYQETNGSTGLQTGTGGDKLVATTVTASNGTYSFTDLAAGTYYVAESVPTGYIQTGGGPNGSAGCTYYTISASAGQTYTGNNFDDYFEPTCSPSSYSFAVTNNCGVTTKGLTNLSGNTAKCDAVTVTFTVTMTEQLTLVSYIAPSNTWNQSIAYEQQIFDQDSGTYTPGTYSLTVLIPNCDYQIDFVCGPAINELAPPTYNGVAYGPDSGNVLYHSENRAISSDNEGTQTFANKSISSGDFGTTALWTSTTGKTCGQRSSIASTVLPRPLTLHSGWPPPSPICTVQARGPMPWSAEACTTRTRRWRRHTPPNSPAPINRFSPRRY